MSPKEIITQTNIRSYFDYRAVSTMQLKPGMLVSFRYRSPDRHIHDVNPLVYILENKGDRVYGLNLHYHFGLMGGLIMLKRKELQKKTGYNDTTNQPAQQQNSLQQKPLTQTKVVNAQQQKMQQQQQKQQKQSIGIQKPQSAIIKPVSKIRIPPQLLETYELQIEPASILRNYLFIRMSGLQKLIFKP